MEFKMSATALARWKLRIGSLELLGREICDDFVVMAGLVGEPECYIINDLHKMKEEWTLVTVKNWPNKFLFMECDGHDPDYSLKVRKMVLKRNLVLHRHSQGGWEYKPNYLEIARLMISMDQEGLEALLS